jgi:outer membrane receptor protein involved in Fe transport
MDRREYQVGSYGVNEVLLSGLAGLALKTTHSKVGLTLMHIQNGTSKAGIFDYEGSDQGSDFTAFQHGLDYSQRSLSQLLLDGNHFNPERKLRINWKLSGAYSLMNDPDVRFTRYEINPDGSLRIGTEVGFPERIWRNLNELNSTALVNFSKDFKINENASKLHFGALATYKNRDYIIRNFSIVPRGDYTLTGNPDELFFEENLWPKDGETGVGTTYETPFIPTNPNQYNAYSINTGGYISGELTFVPGITTIVGVRLENYMQYYTGTDQLRSNILDNEKVLSDLGVYPSLNLMFKLTERQNLRASYSMTVARPSFKELSYAEIYDPISGITFIGGFHKDGDDQEGVEYWSGNLVSTNIQNMDLRWESFGKDKQMISVGGFYKLFDNPIEIVQYTKQVGAFQPRNVGDGQTYGVELEFRQSMGFISERIRGLRLNANITFTRSRIEMSETEYQSRVENARLGQDVEEYRPMAGQAPYLVNGGISYSGGEKGFWNRLEAGLFYNVQGTTLEFVGVADRPDIYTQPFHSLNFNSSVKLGSNQRWVLGLKVQNLLDENIELVYKSFNAQDQFFERRSPGISTTLKLTYNF